MVDISRSSRKTQFWKDRHIPGPGTYRTPKNSPPFYTFRQSLNPPDHEHSPGPGSYFLSESLKNKSTNSVFMNKDSRVSPNDMVFTSIHYRNKSSDVPGPGSYYTPGKPVMASPPVLKFVTLERNTTKCSDLRFNNEKVYLKRKPDRKVKNEVWSRLKGVGFSTDSGDRHLWEPNNFRHPYKMPAIENPGPGYYLLRGTFDKNFYRNSIG